MRRGQRAGACIGVLTLAVLGACTDHAPDGSVTRLPTTTGSPVIEASASGTGSESPNVDAPEWIAYGLVLRPGHDGRLPVKLRWIHALAAPEQLAVDGNRVYVFDEAALCFRLSDGAVVWKTYLPNGNGLASDGGVAIGLDGPDTVRFWSWFNDDISVDRRTGRFLEHRRAGNRLPSSMRVFPSPKPSEFRVDTSKVRRVTARWPSGEIAWTLHMSEAWYDSTRAVAVPGGLALITGSGHLVVLDHT